MKQLLIFLLIAGHIIVKGVAAAVHMTEDYEHGHDVPHQHFLTGDTVLIQDIGHHDHDENDPHIWLDPVQMVDVVELMCAALTEVQPESADMFRGNADALIAELVALDGAIQDQLAPYAGRAFFINHPALGHFSETVTDAMRSGRRPTAVAFGDDVWLMCSVDDPDRAAALAGATRGRYTP